MSSSPDEGSSRHLFRGAVAELVQDEVSPRYSARAHVSDAAISSATSSRGWLCGRGHDAVRGERCPVCAGELELELAELRTARRIRARDGRE